MKRNFLLMLLMTLLPLAGWAFQAEPVYLYLAATNGAVGSNLPEVSVRTTADDATTAISTDYYTVAWEDPDDEPVAALSTTTKSGTYKVTVTLTNDGQEIYSFATGPTATEAEGTYLTSGDLQTPTQVEVQVTPVSGQTLAYRTPVDKLAVTANMVSITVNPASMNPFLDEQDNGRAFIAQFLKFDNAEDLSTAQVGPETYRFATKTAEELGQITIPASLDGATVSTGKVILNGVTYYIKPILDGTINIVAGENELINYGTPADNNPIYAFATITGIPYNGQAQDLVAGTVYDFATFGAAEGDENPYGTGQALFIGQETVGEGAAAVTYTGIRVLSNKPANDQVQNAASFEGQTFYVKATRANGIPTGRLQLYTKDGDTFAEQPIYAEISAADVSWAKYTNESDEKDKGVKFFFISKTQFEGSQELEEDQQATPFNKDAYVIPEDANWSAAIPQGTDVDEYYVWAKAAEGGTNYTASDPVFLGTASIVPATPTLAGTITVDPVYYVFTGTDNFQGLKKKVEPQAQVNATFAGSTATTDVSAKLTYLVLEGTKDAQGTIIPTDGNWYPLANIQTFTAGKSYKVMAIYQATDNPNLKTTGWSEVVTSFDVERPTITLTTTSKIETIPFGVQPSVDDFGYSVTWTDGFAEADLNLTEPNTAEYSWVAKETGSPIGEYEVSVKTDGFFTYNDADFDIKVVPVIVRVLAGNVFADIEDQTLVFGETLPLTLTYVQGYLAPSETEAIENFNKQVYRDGTLKATMIKDAEGNDVENEVVIPLYAASYTTNRVTNWVTTVLPVGTWEVTADFGNQDNAAYKFAVSKGTWKVTPRDITDGVRGTRRFNPHKTYTSEAIELDEFDFYGSDIRYRDIDDKPDELSRRGRNNPNGNLSDAAWNSLFFGNLNPYFEPEADEVAVEEGAQPIVDVVNPAHQDFKIVGYKDNINAGTATVTIEGITNFKGTRDLTFTIDKARLLVYPAIPEGGNKWKLGTSEEGKYTYDVNGAGISIPGNVYDEEKDGPGRKVYAEDADPDEDDPLYVITYEGGIKTQINHYFPGDKDLDVTTAKGFKDLAVQRTVPATVGVYTPGLKAYQKKDEATGKVEEADNYTFDFMTAPLEIQKGDIQVTVATAEATYNGTTKGVDPDNPYKKDFKLANEEELIPALAENWKSVVEITYENAEFTDNWAAVKGADDKMRFNAGNYKIDAAPKENKSWADVFSATNYNVSFVAPTANNLTVNPREITLTVKPANYEGELPATWTFNLASYMTEDGFDRDQLDADIDAIARTPILDTDGKPTGEYNVNYDNVTVGGDGLGNGDEKKDVVASITVDQDENTISVNPITTNTNYMQPIETVDGVLVINPLSGDAELVLKSVMEDAAEYETNAWGEPVLDKDGKPVVKPGTFEKGDKHKLTDYNGVSVKNISLTLKAPKLTQGETENAAFAKWNKNEWHAMVLPFAVTAEDLSAAFGNYALVNVVDVENTEEGHVRFMQPIEIDAPIEANTPFCVKTAAAFDYETEKLEFFRGENKAPFVIVAPDFTKSDIVVYNFENECGYTLEGSYMQENLITSATPNIRFLGPGKWYYVSKDNTKYYMQPYTGYVNMGEGSETKEVIFTFEEEDGSTTDIKAVDFLNGNKVNAEGLYRVDGVKMNTVPAQKGVYIQDGKKFVK